MRSEKITYSIEVAAGCAGVHPVSLARWCADDDFRQTGARKKAGTRRYTAQDCIALIAGANVEAVGFPSEDVWRVRRMVQRGERPEMERAGIVAYRKPQHELITQEYSPNVRIAAKHKRDAGALVETSAGLGFYTIAQLAADCLTEFLEQHGPTPQIGAAR